MYTIAILAAGTSKRLGQPKQLLPWNQKNLLQHTLDEAEKLEFPVLLILGAFYKNIEDTIVPGPQTRVLFNENWPEGMASSVRMAVEQVSADTEYLLFCVCDQPYLDAEILRQLMQQQQLTRQPIVGARYQNGTTGVPMLLHRTFFADLQALSGDVGAKKIAARHPDKLATFDFPLGYLDVDTFDDYAQLTHP
jgi:molybdenum cofactor cytidylyltransferase